MKAMKRENETYDKACVRTPMKAENDMRHGNYEEAGGRTGRENRAIGQIYYRNRQ